MRLLRKFFHLESAGGILLLIMAVLALIVKNSSFAYLYDLFLDTHISIHIGPIQHFDVYLLHFDGHMLHFINDGLMAIFFLLVGMEVKREMVQGELAKVSQMVLPGIAALGGMMAPAIIFVLINSGNTANLPGWAIPTATDIAFALGVLSLFGKRVPISLKMFLMTLAVLDDLGAVVIIALFYSHGINAMAIMICLVFIGILFLMNRRGVVTVTPYWVMGILLWFYMMHSGLHATLAGVIVAFMVPIKRMGPEGMPPLLRLGKDLHIPVTFIILPLFAFVNAGVSFFGTSFDLFLEPLTLGIFASLFIGKQIGVFTFTWLSVKLKLAKIPKGVTWGQFYGVSMLCGIGFTMSLFISSLAFHPAANKLYRNPMFMAAPRVGILAGSLISAIAGYFVLNKSLKKIKKR